MAHLAIRGYATRGNEVIEILGMLGGSNKFEHVGNNQLAMYYIDENYKNYITCSITNDNNIFFTLEEFLEKFHYKVGDKVQHKGATSCGTVYVIEKMRWVGDNVEYTVKHLYYNNCHSVVTTEDLQPYEEETMEERKYADLRLDVDQDDKLATEATIDGDKITPPKNYLIGKITKVDNGMIVEFVKKQPQYPKTFIEVLNFWHPDRQIEDDYQRCYKKYIIEKLQDLLYARDAYWKIAGEQMGLGKPWEPNWLNAEQDKYVLYTHNNVICSNRFLFGHNVLAFPTAEMRDAFFENFKELIEQCKELL